MELKKASIENNIALKTICIDAYSLNFYDHWNDGGLEWYLDNEFSDKRIAQDLSDKNTAYYFLTHNEKHIGFVKTKSSAYIDFIANAVELEKIYVLPEYKGMGIGKQALSAIIQDTSKSGKEHIFLSVIDSNESAITFYEKLGFKFHSKTILEVPYFKEELKGMHRMIKKLN